MRGVEMGADEIKAGGWDEVIVATGSVPARDGYQRALPFQASLPGVHQANVFAIEDVLDGSAKCGHRVLVLDDLGQWPGAGTALKLAEAGHQVAIVTRHPVIGAELVNSAAVPPLMKRLGELKVAMLTETAILSWDGNEASLKSLLDGAVVTRGFDTLVTSTVNSPVRALFDALDGAAGFVLHNIGDSLAPRKAAAAIYEGRKLALRI
jgi:hypothetical protein